MLWRVASEQKVFHQALHAPDVSDAVRRLPGFRIVRVIDDHITCYQFVFGNRSGLEEVIEEILIDGEEVDPALIGRGHIAFYTPHDVVLSAADITHVALGVGEGKVLSKFGSMRHIIEHPYRLVPSKDGENVLVFTRPPGVLLNTEFHSME